MQLIASNNITLKIDNDKLWCNPPDIQSPNLTIEITGIGLEYASKIKRGVVWKDNDFRSLKPLLVDSRMGFVGEAKTIYPKDINFAVQLNDDLVGVWNIIDPIVVSPLGNPTIGYFSDKLPPMVPDYSFVPFPGSLPGRDILGYGKENWLWEPDFDYYIGKIKECGLNTVYASLVGSGETVTTNANTNWTEYWMKNPELLIAYITKMMVACRKHEVMAYWHFVSGNSGVICKPDYDDTFIMRLITFFRDAMGWGYSCILGCNEPWHPKANTCFNKLRTWDLLISDNYPGAKAENENYAINNFYHEVHPQHKNDFGPDEDVVLVTDSAIINYLTNNNPCGVGYPPNVYNYSKDAYIRHRGLIYYAYWWELCNVVDIPCFQALKAGRTQKEYNA